MRVLIFSAAKGNPTAIVVASNLGRDNYPIINGEIQRQYPEVEQVGFYEEEDNRPKLQMAGGEFCGNATRSFACLLKEFYPDRDSFDFYVSGYEGPVSARVEEVSDGDYFCQAELGEMPCRIERKSFQGVYFKVVDLGGITHIVVQEDDYSFCDNNYARQVEKVRTQLGVDNSAVGVLWIKEVRDLIYMKPVVWVKDIDTCYYETSCGSGSIAVALEKGRDAEIIQPSGAGIRVERKNGKLILSSVMKKIKEVDYVGKF